MSLTLYFHPLSSFCHKVLIALYENETPFEAVFVDLGDARGRAEFLALSPMGKMPLLRDEKRGCTVPETTIIIEYLARHYPGPTPLLPADPEIRLQARLWDRFFDLYVMAPMQTLVADRLREAAMRDPLNVSSARAMLRTSYDIIERRLADHTWAAGNAFSLADCAAIPALFYASIAEAFPPGHRNLAAYFERLMNRPTAIRVLAEAQPYFNLFPLRESIPARFLTAAA